MGKNKSWWPKKRGRKKTFTGILKDVSKAGRTMAAIGAIAAGAKVRRKVKVGPLSLNLSRQGISPTIGIKGLNINLNKTGTYLNLGIPGTGIYDRIKLDKKPKIKKDNFVPLSEEETLVEFFAEFLEKEKEPTEEKVENWLRKRIQKLLNGDTFVFSNGIYLTSYANLPPGVEHEIRCSCPRCYGICEPKSMGNVFCCLSFFIFPLCLLFLLIPTVYECKECGREHPKEDVLVRFQGE